MSMGQLTAAAWTATGEHWRQRDVEVPAHPDPHVRTPAGGARLARRKISGGGLDVEAALEMALRTQAYDRLARHSSAVDRLVVGLVSPRAV